MKLLMLRITSELWPHEVHSNVFDEEVNKLLKDFKCAMATRCLSGVNETRKPMKKMCPKKVINEIDDSSKDLIDIDEENVFQESYK